MNNKIEIPDLMIYAMALEIKNFDTVLHVNGGRCHYCTISMPSQNLFSVTATSFVLEKTPKILPERSRIELLEVYSWNDSSFMNCI